MMPIEAAILKLRKEAVRAASTMSSRPFPTPVGERSSRLLIGCHVTGRCCFVNAVFRSIRLL